MNKKGEFEVYDREYNESPERWFHIVEKSSNKKFYKKQESYITKILSHREFFGDKILNAGCGYGRFTTIEQNLGYDVTSVDKSYPMVEVTKKINPKTCQMQMENLKFKDRTFDTIEFIDVVDHCISLKDVISEANRVLKDTGAIIFTASYPNIHTRFNQFVKSVLGRFGIWTAPKSNYWNRVETIGILGNEMDWLVIPIKNFGTVYQNIFIGKKTDSLKTVAFFRGILSELNLKGEIW